MTGLVIVLWAILIAFAMIAVVLIGIIINLTLRIKRAQTSCQKTQQRVNEAMSLVSTIGSALALMAGLIKYLKRPRRKS